MSQDSTNQSAITLKPTKIKKKNFGHLIMFLRIVWDLTECVLCLQTGCKMQVVRVISTLMPEPQICQ